MDAAEQGPKAGMPQAALQWVIDDILKSLPASLARAIRLGAISRWTNPALLHQLAGDEVAVEQLIDALLQFQFAEQDTQGSIHYRDGVREILLAQANQEDAQKIRAAHRVAIAYFSRAAANAPLSEQQSLRREILYHLIYLDERAGLVQLNEQMETLICNHQSGELELLVQVAAQNADSLSDTGRSWLRYFTACLNLARGKDGAGEDVFSALAADAPEDLLGALATWKLGQVRVGQRCWSEAIRLYADSLRRIKTTGETIFRARVMLSMGDAYCLMADQSGGFALELRENHPGAVNCLTLPLHYLLYLPFILALWLLHRVNILPGLNIGTNYQHWILAYLEHTAAAWYRRAARLLRARENSMECIESRLDLAYIEYREDRWSRAEYSYRLLERIAAVTQSQYRMAKIRLGQGQVELGRGRLERAIALLKEAAETFHIYRDMESLGKTTFALGLAWEELGKPAEAAEAYLESADAFREACDGLALTRLIWHLDGFRLRFSLPDRLNEAITALKDRLPERTSLAPFPAHILSFFRRLAIYFALPITYGFAILISLIGISVLISLESVFTGPAHAVPWGAVFIFAVLSILPFLLAFWIYRAIYSLFGLFAVTIFGRQIDPIERETPVYLSVDRTGILRTHSREIRPMERNKRQPEAALETERNIWMDLTACFSVNYRLRGRPIYLVSSTFFVFQPQSDNLSQKLLAKDLPGQSIIPVDGITAGYEAMTRDIHTILQGLSLTGKERNRDFIFFETRWLSALVLFCLSGVAYLYNANKIKIISGNGAALFISVVVTFTVLTLLISFPTVTLWRLLVHQVRLKKEVGRQAVIVPTWLILLLAILSTAIVLGLGWLLL